MSSVEQDIFRFAIFALRMIESGEGGTLAGEHSAQLRREFDVAGACDLVAA